MEPTILLRPEPCSRLANMANAEASLSVNSSGHKDVIFTRNLLLHCYLGCHKLGCVIVFNGHTKG